MSPIKNIDTIDAINLMGDSGAGMNNLLSNNKYISDTLQREQIAVNAAASAAAKI